MAVDVRVERTGQAVLRALEEVAPSQAETFRREYRAALAEAAESLDLAKADAVLSRWWGIAYLRLNPPTAEEQDLVRRLQAGEDVGWSSPQEWLAARGR